MRGIGRFLTALALVASLLLGAAGGVSAHALMADHPSMAGTAAPDSPCAGHDHQASPDGQPDPGRHHAMPMAAMCCPALPAPSRLEVSRTAAVRQVAWHPGAAQAPSVRLIAPETPPPKPAA